MVFSCLCVFHVQCFTLQTHTHVNKHYDHYCVDVSLLYSLQGFTSRGPNCHQRGSKCSKIKVVRVTSSGVFLLLFPCPATEPFVLAVFCAPVRIHYQTKLLRRLRFRRRASVASIVQRRFTQENLTHMLNTGLTFTWPVVTDFFTIFPPWLNAPHNMVLTLKNLS